MKCSVCKEIKAGAILALPVLIIGFFTQADETGLIFLMLIAMLVYALIDDPPSWLRNSFLRRWLRR